MKAFLSDTSNFLFSVFMLTFITTVSFFIGTQVGSSVNGQANFHAGYKQALSDFKIVPKEQQ